MSQPLDAQPAPVAGPLAGDYYGPRYLYRVAWEAGHYQQARCCQPAATPALDVFEPAYPVTEAQLLRLLAFGGFTPALDFSWPAPSDTTPNSSTTRPACATTDG